MAKREPIHPGEVLSVEFLDELGITPYALAKAIDVPPNRITGIVNRERAVSVDTALRLARFFGTTAEFWLNLQNGYDLRKANTASLERDLQRIEERRAAYLA